MTHRYHWGNTPERARLKGKLCRVVARGAMRSVLLQFENGHRTVTSARAVRRIK